jgi:hypothetical protein
VEVGSTLMAHQTFAPRHPSGPPWMLLSLAARSGAVGVPGPHLDTYPRGISHIPVSLPLAFPASKVCYLLAFSCFRFLCWDLPFLRGAYLAPVSRTDTDLVGLSRGSVTHCFLVLPLPRPFLANKHHKHHNPTSGIAWLSASDQTACALPKEPPPRLPLSKT